MQNRPELRCFLGLGLGAWLLIATGCAPAARAAPPASPAIRDGASSGADPKAPRSNVVVDDPNEVPVSSVIRKVTVYSDRALVSRQGAVKIATTPTVYAFRQLPGWVDEGSVRAATSAGKIVDVRVVRGYLARATEPRYVRAEADARELSGRLAALDDELKVLDAKAKQVEDIKAFSMDRLNKEIAAGGPHAESPATTGPVGVATYASVVD